MNTANVVWISCLTEISLYDIFIDRGIDLKKFQTTLTKGLPVIFFLDDAQEIYSDTKFWEHLIKIGPTWLPQNVRFVISSTHLVSYGNSSPVVFESITKLGRDDFLLSHEESIEFLELPVIGLPPDMRNETLKHVISRECGGLIGALRQSVDSLKERFRKNHTEADLLQHFLSETLLFKMGRCFGDKHSSQIGYNFRVLLNKIIFAENQNVKSLEEQDMDSYSSLLKAGILVQFPDKSFGFSSPLAYRYYFQWLFPNRSSTPPSNLFELVKNVISSMSATMLRYSTTAGDFPKEAVFQHLFFEGLALFTQPNCSICPELSKIFPGNPTTSTQQKIAGEIDFYLNSTLRWGIELLVNGSGIGEHISRFSPNGKYAPLDVTDYAVVDFRGNTEGTRTNIMRDPKRISVFFKIGDLSAAQCIFGEEDVSICLSN